MSLSNGYECIEKTVESLLNDLISQVFQLKVDGVAFRLIPELSQVKNAIKVSRFPAEAMLWLKCDALGWDFPVDRAKFG